ncbi:transposase [Sinorhizobium medicae]|uniref:transposase n=1 Tax=Sinorhizobium medicae TaxID=110321 RepID=UPI00307E2F1A
MGQAQGPCPAVHGFKAHADADADTALFEEIAIAPANINDGKAGPEALPDDPGEVFADSAYRGSHFGDAVRAIRVARAGITTRRKNGAHYEAETTRFITDLREALRRSASSSEGAESRSCRV